MENAKTEPEMTYKTSNGREVPISKMEDTFLVNAIRKIERNSPDIKTVDPGPLYAAMRSELANRCEKTRTWYEQRVKENK